MRKDRELKYIWLLVLFFFSGFSALIYEVTWARKLSLVFGTDSFAVSTIIAVFFTGLALGSFIFGKAVDRQKSLGSKKVQTAINPLLLYALLEVGIGVYAVFSPLIFKGVGSLQIVFLKSFNPSFTGFNIFTLLLSSLALIIPTFLMGGTLPVISKVIKSINGFGRSDRDTIEKKVGGLYAVNTSGAVLGTILTGFWFIFKLGVNQTIVLAAVVSVGVGIIAFWMSKFVVGSEYKRRQDLEEKSSPFRYIILLTFGVAGFSAIALEVVWTRVLMMIIGGSTYSFTIVLSAYLIGIALGSAFISLFINRIKSPLVWFGIVEVLLGISVVLFIPVWGQLPYWFLDVFRSFGNSFGGLQFGLWLMTVGVMIVPTLLMGAAFPLVIKAYTISKLGTRVGEVYSVNTVGGVLGSLLAGFALVPLIGTQNSVLISAGIYLVVGLIVILISSVGVWKKVSLALLSVIAVFVGINFTPWDYSLFASGIYVEPESVTSLDREKLVKELGKDEVLYQAEGITAHVAVRKERSGNVNLRINGKTDASISADMENQLLLGHLPMLLHKDPKEVLVIGMGSGITLGSVLTYPVDNVDAVEIEAKVVEAAEFFNEYSNNALSDKRVNIIIADGRHYLLATDKKYDVISSEPSNPWLAGSSKLFTKEYFELLKASVKDDGLVLHWINLYFLDVDGLKSVLAAYGEVFPHIAVFGVAASNDLVLIGSEKPISFDWELLEERFENEKIIADLAKVEITDPEEILAYYVFSKEVLDDIASEGIVNTDNYPYIEFAAPRSLYLPVSVNPWRVVHNNLSPIDSILEKTEKTEVQIDQAERFRDARLLTQIHYIENNIGEGIKEGEEAIGIDSENPELIMTVAQLYFEQGSAFLNQQNYKEALVSFENSLKFKETPETYINLAASLAGIGDLDEARQYLEKTITLDDELAVVYFRLGEVNQEIGDLNSAIKAFEKVVELDSNNAEALTWLGQLYILRQDFGKAKVYLNKALKINPELEEAENLLRSIP